MTPTTTDSYSSQSTTSLNRTTSTRLSSDHARLHHEVLPSSGIKHPETRHQRNANPDPNEAPKEYPHHRHSHQRRHDDSKSPFSCIRRRITKSFVGPEKIHNQANLDKGVADNTEAELNAVRTRNVVINNALWGRGYSTPRQRCLRNETTRVLNKLVPRCHNCRINTRVQRQPSVLPRLRNRGPLTSRGRCPNNTSFLLQARSRNKSTRQTRPLKQAARECSAPRLGLQASFRPRS